MVAAAAAGLKVAAERAGHAVRVAAARDRARLRIARVAQVHFSVARKLRVKRDVRQPLRDASVAKWMKDEQQARTASAKVQTLGTVQRSFTNTPVSRRLTLMPPYCHAHQITRASTSDAVKERERERENALWTR
jgi:hypothetical protein